MTVQRWLIITLLLISLIILSVSAEKEERRGQDSSLEERGNKNIKKTRENGGKKSNKNKNKAQQKKKKKAEKNKDRKKKRKERKQKRRKLKRERKQRKKKRGNKKDNRKKVEKEKKRKRKQKRRKGLRKKTKSGKVIRQCQDVECLNTLLQVTKINRDTVKNFLRQRKRMVARLGVIENKVNKSNKTSTSMSTLANALGGSSAVKSSSPICGGRYNSTTATDVRNYNNNILSI